MTLSWSPKDVPLPHASHLAAPLYLSMDRGAILTEVQLPVGSKEEAESWTLAGVALLLGA